MKFGSKKENINRFTFIGPRVFTMYPQYVSTIIRRHGLNYHIFADDVQIYMSFDCLSIVFQIGSEVITPSPTIKNLGITFGSAMTMSDHVISLFKSVIFLLWNLARIRRFIDHNAASNTMRALILSKLDYGNALFSSCKNKDVARLQRLQNRAARIELQVPRRHSSSPLLASLHWLPIDKRIKFKILLHIYKALNDLSPVYLTECITIHLPSREGFRSSVDTTCLVVPRSTRRIGDRSFSVYGPSLWNQLPISIRSSTVCNLKHALKTHMF